MIVNKEFDNEKQEVHPRVYRLQLTREQEDAVRVETRRWDMDETNMLEFILRWGFKQYFGG